MALRSIPTEIPDVRLIEPVVFGDNRGFFLETYHQKKYEELGIRDIFVQDNHSHSRKGVLRGLHYQLRYPQGKLIYVSYGTIFDVAVDIRRGSPTFGKWVGRILSDRNHHQLYIPGGFAHGFYVLSDWADVIYKCTAFYVPDDDFGIAWWDPTINIDWPLEGQPILSNKDRELKPLKDIPEAMLPVYSP
ncbi:MAG: dTDP-4-dehydrorhamnose 3,5-epimerase [Calditrichaeota bacterium]|nr:dTDP-4-dehydrorhamnose 3,5-epimerase [Calditrichota bacterium]